MLIDLLTQLTLTSAKRDEFITWIQDITGNLKDSQGRRLQFQEWLDKQQDNKKSGKKGNQNNRKKFNQWLTDNCKKPFEEYVLNQYPTHQTIWNLLHEAKQKELVTEDAMRALILFREVVLDTFLLLDQDHDQKLRKLTLDQEGQWGEGDLCENIIQ